MLEEVTNHAEAGNLVIVTSTVAIAEVIKLPEIGATTDEQVQQIADYFEHEWISLRTVTTTIARDAVGHQEDERPARKAGLFRRELRDRWR